MVSREGRNRLVASVQEMVLLRQPLAGQRQGRSSAGTRTAASESTRRRTP